MNAQTSADDITEEAERFSNEDDLTRIWRTMTIVGILLAFLSIGILLSHYPVYYPHLKKLIATGWYLGPPAWFLYENTRLLNATEMAKKSIRAAELKLGQDAAKMWWFGIAALVTFLAKS